MPRIYIAVSLHPGSDCASYVSTPVTVEVNAFCKTVTRMFFQFFSGDDGGGLCHKLLGFAVERKRSRMSIFIQVGIHDNLEVLIKVGNGCCRQIAYAAYIKLVGRFYILQSEETVLVPRVRCGLLPLR